jgi:hypothetical protein
MSAPLRASIERPPVGGGDMGEGAALEELVLRALQTAPSRRQDAEVGVLMDWLMSIKFFEDNVRSNYVRSLL